MKTVVLLIIFSVTLLHDTESYSFGENFFDKLNSHIDSINQLIIRIQKTYRDDMYHHPLPKMYYSTLRRAAATLNKSSRVVEQIFGKYCQNENQFNEDDSRKYFNREDDSGELTRRNNNDLMWKSNFYKALSRALKEEFKDEPLIQENVHDGFTPPIKLKNRGQ